MLLWSSHTSTEWAEPVSLDEDASTREKWGDRREGESIREEGVRPRSPQCVLRQTFTGRPTTTRRDGPVIVM